MKKLFFISIMANLVYLALFTGKASVFAAISSTDSEAHHPNPKVERVNLNFQNIEVRSLLQLLADFSTYNFLISDSVSGTISLKLNNVPWEQALTVILNAKGLGRRIEGNVLRVAPLSELDALTKLAQDRQKAEEDLVALTTSTIRLKYAQAAVVHTMLQSDMASGKLQHSLLSARGSILVDSRTNSLILNDTPPRLRNIQALVAKIDIPVPQVLIEARIVEANNDFERRLGARLLLAGIGGSSVLSNTLENGVKLKQAGDKSLGDVAANQSFAKAQSASLAVVFAPHSDTLIGLEIDAEEAMNQGRTISNPKVMVANYQTALIQQGVQIP